MAYLNCPHCRSSNPNTARNCYNCSGQLHSGAPRAASSGPPPPKPVASWPMFLLVIGLATGLGAALGFLVGSVEFDIPRSGTLPTFGLFCSLIVTYAVGKFKGVPERKLMPRLLAASVLGSAIGLSSFAVNWGLAPTGSLTAFGALVGLATALPVAISFSLLGGESRRFGWLELLNLVAGGAFGFLMGGLTQQWNPAIGCAGVGALVTCLVGCRIDVPAVLAEFTSGTGDDTYEGSGFGDY